MTILWAFLRKEVSSLRHLFLLHSVKILQYKTNDALWTRVQKSSKTSLSLLPWWFLFTKLQLNKYRCVTHCISYLCDFQRISLKSAINRERTTYQRTSFRLVSFIQQWFDIPRCQEGKTTGPPSDRSIDPSVCVHSRRGNTGYANTACRMLYGGT